MPMMEVEPKDIPGASCILSATQSFVKTGTIKKYQTKSRQLPQEIDGSHFQDLLSPNLGTNREIFKNKNLQIRKNVLKRRNVPRRDSEENISFWTKNIKDKVIQEAGNKKMNGEHGLFEAV